jgi:hypothetical protein
MSEHQSTLWGLGPMHRVDGVFAWKQTYWTGGEDRWTSYMFRNSWKRKNLTHWVTKQRIDSTALVPKKLSQILMHQAKN